MNPLDNPVFAVLSLLLLIFYAILPIVVCMVYQRLGAVLRELKKLNGGR